MDDLKEVADAIDDMDEELEDIQHGLHKHGEKLEYLDNQSRRNNVRIDGNPEEDNENWLNTETNMCRSEESASGKATLEL